MIITCAECTKDVSDKALSCPNCGVPIRVESKVMVYGYTQNFARNPAVEIFWQGRSIGKVKQADLFEFPITEDGEVSFKCNLVRASLHVRAGRVNKIKIQWKRLSGRMVPQIVDGIVSSNDRN